MTAGNGATTPAHTFAHFLTFLSVIVVGNVTPGGDVLHS